MLCKTLVRTHLEIVCSSVHYRKDVEILDCGEENVVWFREYLLQEKVAQTSIVFHGVWEVMGQPDKSIYITRDIGRQGRQLVSSPGYNCQVHVGICLR